MIEYDSIESLGIESQDTSTVFLAHSSEYRDGNLEIPPQLYRNHVKNVIGLIKKNWHDNIDKNFKDVYGNSDDFIIVKKSFIDAVVMAGEFHDMGKLDPQCQLILKRQSEQGVRMLNHVDAGVAHLCNKYIETDDATFIFAALLINAHHIGLPNLEKLLTRERRGFLVKSSFNIDDLRDYSSCEKYKLGNHTVKDHIDRNLQYYLDIHKSEVGDSEFAREKPIGLDSILLREFFFLKLGLSMLIDADHTDTSCNYGDPLLEKSVDLNIEERQKKLDDFVIQLQSKSSDTPRNRLRKDMYEICKNFQPESRVSLLDATVGMGKTISGFHVACNHARQDKNISSLLVVTPYISLNDQIGDVYKKSVTIGWYEGQVSIIHCLYDYHSIWMRKYAKGLNSPISILTSVSLFNVLLKNKVSFTRKFNKLAGSVIFIDEYHLLAKQEHWKVVLHSLMFLVRYLNVRVVLSSGTPIEYWNIDQVSKKRAKENGSNEDFIVHWNVERVLHQEFIDKMYEFERNRVKVKNINEKISLENIKKMISRKNGNIFIVLETIKKSNNLYKMLEDVKDRRVYFRHSGLSPKDRDIQIKKMKDDMVSGRDVILVSTPGSDVGLDLSFNHGFREDTDSNGFLQIQGRINRNGEYEDATLTRFALLKSEGHSNPANYRGKKALEKFLSLNNSITPEECTRIAQIEYDEDSGGMVEKMVSLKEGIDAGSHDSLSRQFNLIGNPSLCLLVDGDVYSKILDNEYVKSADIQENLVTKIDYNGELLNDLLKHKKVVIVEEEIEKQHGKRSGKFRGHGNLLFWLGDYDEIAKGIFADGFWNT